MIIPEKAFGDTTLHHALMADESFEYSHENNYDSPVELRIRTDGSIAGRSAKLGAVLVQASAKYYIRVSSDVSDRVPEYSEGRGAQVPGFGLVSLLVPSSDPMQSPR